MERMIKIEGAIRQCDCKRQPRAYRDSRNGGSFFFECSPCRIRTANMPTLQEALQLWEDNKMQRVMENAA